MRISGQTKGNVRKFIYLILSLMIVIDIITYNLEGTFSTMMKFYPYTLVIIAFLMWRGLPVFEYDSDGEVLIFTAKDPALMAFSRKFVMHSEFPRRKLKGYKFKVYPFRKILYVNIESKEGGVKKNKISLSYISKRDFKDLERSLRGVMKKNKEREEVQQNDE